MRNPIAVLAFTLLLAACGEELVDGSDELSDTEGDANDEAVVASDLKSLLPFKNGFETGSLQGWGCSGNCPHPTTAPVYSGHYAGDFVLTRNLATPYRTEAVNGVHFAFGRDYSLSLNYRYQDWAKDRDTEAAPFQIHSTPGSWDFACSLHSAYSTAPFLMVAQNDVAKFITYGGKVLWQGSLEKQKWLGITVRFRVSTGADGYVEAWKDGVKLGRVTGANSPLKDNCGNAMKEPYFKMGIYKWNWKEGRRATDSTRRELLIDNVNIWEGSGATPQ